MKLFRKKHYTVASMMADLSEEKREAAVMEVDLQYYLDIIKEEAENGYNKAFFCFQEYSY